MAANPTGGPETNPGTHGGASGLGPRSFTTPKREATQDMDSILTRVLDHRADHGNGLFTHPSTNRGNSPGALNGEPARNPGEPQPVTPRRVDVPFHPRIGNGLPRRGEKTPNGLIRRGEGLPTPTPPTSSNQSESQRGKGGRQYESGSSRAVHQGQQDLARNNRSGS